MRILHIIIKKKYFDQIAEGSKTIEYRLVKPYWVNKIVGINYDYILFQNGYSRNSPKLKVKYLGYEIVNLKHELFGEHQVTVFALKLGAIKKQ